MFQNCEFYIDSHTLLRNKEVLAVILGEVVVAGLSHRKKGNVLFGAAVVFPADAGHGHDRL